MPEKLPTRLENYSEWYNELVIRAGLAQHSEVRGCMIIKPYGYAIWELMQAELDKQFKATGHQNAYFPLLIPKSFLSKEASHVEGFAKECAVVTHYRLKNDPNGGGVIVDPEAKLEEELIIRPTSETIIWNTYRDWIQSYRDLPILINQWCNVMRWEMRTRLFLRTSEFLWQEGHTAHASSEEALEESQKMLGVYQEFAENFLAISVVPGQKPEHEKFAGAEITYCIESMMQDGKALQAGTSHFLGQNFAKAFDVKFLNKDNQEEYVYATSWGVSTRLMGALVMSHSDDKGLVLPPKVAPIQVVMVPIYGNEEEKKVVMDTCKDFESQLVSEGVRVKVDSDDTKRPGWKFAEWELKGVPVRLTVGYRDLQQGLVEIARRDHDDKMQESVEKTVSVTLELLRSIQGDLFEKHKKLREEKTEIANSYDEFKELLDQGYFLMAHWDGTTETADKIKEETGATIRCIPQEQKKEEGLVQRNTGEAGKCLYSGKVSNQRVLFARAY